MAWWIFQNLVITTALAGAVALACRAGRIGPVARHALWVLVLVKFVTPPLVVWPWAAPDPFGIAALDAGASPENPKDSGLSDGALTVTPRPVGSVETARPEGQTARDETRDTAGARGRSATSVWSWLLGLWALGSLCMMGLEGLRLTRLARRVRSGPADPTVVARVEVLSARLGIRPVPVVRVAGMTSPVVWGWWRPRLLWPEALTVDVTEACIDGIVVHELAHIKRGDHLIGWIELAGGVVWWWNPLFWSVRSAVREQAELACDAWVISELPNGRRAYAESLLALSGAAVLNPSSMAVVGIRPTSRRLLERRLVMIMKGRSSLRLPWAGLCCLALVAAATLPAWAGQTQQPPPPPSPVPGPAAVIVKQVPPAPPQKVAPARRVVRQKEGVAVNFQAAPKVPPPPIAAKVMPSLRTFHTVNVRTANLPPDGKELLETYDADVKAIQAEIDHKLEARRAAAVKALEALQDQYTKAGKLDEAVAIRDYLRAGGPGAGLGRYSYTLRRKP